ncbi:MAG: SUMF1/EgtB/PvdO family nonheme iron enzyme [Prevotellaceae bacterium]|jgi:formylglycine-generating enzyme required for sulfatase activity|nr:SUMF1/EgtB/PvdO family nonheme iron enzyme [Prevotellaceae bacterium]
MEKRYEVFVSSTYKDLQDERRKVMETILELGHFPVGMELFSAANDTQWEVIKRLISECDYYVLIIAGRYGSIDEESGKSYTQKEYEYALEKKVPNIAFYHKNPGSISKELCDSGKEEEKLNDFKKIVLSKLCRDYQSADELARKVAIDLPKLIERYPRPGWVKGGSLVTPKDREPPKPVPPKPPVFPSHPGEPEMINVEGGTFNMGSLDGFDNERPIHLVTVSDFSIGKYPVTQKQWRAVMGNNPSTSNKGDNYPVDSVNWGDAQEFCKRLSRATGKQYRLPTEAEWEYAAKGGKKSRNYEYSGSDDLNEVGWYLGNSGSTTHEVGKLHPNELGIYDMSGNVWEWCSDWYGAYSIDKQKDPTGAPSGSDRVLRGGGWPDFAGDCRSANRSFNAPGYRSSRGGFRVVVPL